MFYERIIALSNQYTEENLIRAASYLPSSREREQEAANIAASADPLSAEKTQTNTAQNAAVKAAVARRVTGR